LRPDVEHGSYNCRPYLTGSIETCELTAQTSPRNGAQIMVRGYSAAVYNLSVTFVPE
jgi:hypothetical protein